MTVSLVRRPNRRRPLRPRTWSFTSRIDGRQYTETCPEWCTVDHTRDIETPTFPVDVWHQSSGQEVTLPVIHDSERPDEYRILRVTLNLLPYSDVMAERVPHASVELVDDHYIEGLNPEALAMVIDTFAAQIDQMRAAHTFLVRAIAQHERTAA